MEGGRPFGAVPVYLVENGTGYPTTSRPPGAGSTRGRLGVPASMPARRSASLLTRMVWWLHRAQRYRPAGDRLAGPAGPGRPARPRPLRLPRPRATARAPGTPVRTVLPVNSWSACISGREMSAIRPLAAYKSCGPVLPAVESAQTPWPGRNAAGSRLLARSDSLPCAPAVSGCGAVNVQLN
jgi:hypothetical protein